MKHSTRSIVILFSAILLAGILLLGTAYIPRQGHPLTYIEGQATHRDVRGMPFIFLKRSVGDGQCDLNDQAFGKCRPDPGSEPHQILAPYLGLDIIFWLAITVLPAIFILRKRKD